MKLGIARLVVPAFLLLIAPLAAEAQAPSKVWRIALGDILPPGTKEGRIP
jgi:hypothetical protein